MNEIHNGKLKGIAEYNNLNEALKQKQEQPLEALVKSSLEKLSSEVARAEFERLYKKDKQQGERAAEQAKKQIGQTGATSSDDILKILSTNLQPLSSELARQVFFTTAKECAKQESSINTSDSNPPQLQESTNNDAQLINKEIQRQSSSSDDSAYSDEAILEKISKGSKTPVGSCENVWVWLGFAIASKEEPIKKEIQKNLRCIKNEKKSDHDKIWAYQEIMLSMKKNYTSMKNIKDKFDRYLSNSTNLSDLNFGERVIDLDVEMASSQFQSTVDRELLSTKQQLNMKEKTDTEQINLLYDSVSNITNIQQFTNTSNQSIDFANIQQEENVIDNRYNTAQDVLQFKFLTENFSRQNEEIVISDISKDKINEKDYSPIYLNSVDFDDNILKKEVLKAFTTRKDSYENLWSWISEKARNMDYNIKYYADLVKINENDISKSLNAWKELKLLLTKDNKGATEDTKAFYQEIMAVLSDSTNAGALDQNSSSFLSSIQSEGYSFSSDVGTTSSLSQAMPFDSLLSTEISRIPPNTSELGIEGILQPSNTEIPNIDTVGVSGYGESDSVYSMMTKLLSNPNADFTYLQQEEDRIDDTLEKEVLKGFNTPVNKYRNVWSCVSHRSSKMADEIRYQVDLIGMNEKNTKKSIEAWRELKLLLTKNDKGATISTKIFYEEIMDMLSDSTSAGVTTSSPNMETVEQSSLATASNEQVQSIFEQSNLASNWSTFNESITLNVPYDYYNNVLPEQDPITSNITFESLEHFPEPTSLASISKNTSPDLSGTQSRDETIDLSDKALMKEVQAGLQSGGYYETIWKRINNSVSGTNIEGSVKNTMKLYIGEILDNKNMKQKIIALRELKILLTDSEHATDRTRMFHTEMLRRLGMTSSS